MRRTSVSLLNKFNLLIFGVAMLLLSCSQHNTENDADLKAKFAVIDSLSIIGEGPKANKELTAIRAGITTSNPLICEYHYRMVEFFGGKPQTLNLHADSAMAFFSSDRRIKDYPDQYFKTLLIKGDACLSENKYITALTYYFKAKNALANSTLCDDGRLAAKMGRIYFNQRNYKMAAKYWAESYYKLQQCNQSSSRNKVYFSLQGALNNAGYSFDRAGMLDSALHYYMLDVALINKINGNNAFVNGARGVVYDNLGGLNLKLGKLNEAENYLLKAVALPNTNADGMLIPPYLKLGELYLKTGDTDKALAALNSSKALLNHFYADNAELFIKWHKLYAELLAKQNKPSEAYAYQSKYIRLRDSLENNSAELYHLDVERELITIRQQEQLTELQQKDKVRLNYLAGIGVIALLCVVIIVMINRNLKITQKNHRNATLNNQHLQSTLAELERVNKNYIRIMRVMAHDLRNPLSGMTGIASLLLGEEDFSEDHKHMLKLIETTGSHSMEMINELLKTGLADENETMEKENIDLKALLFDSVELLQFKADDKSQKIVFETNDLPVMASVNHEKIWRVFNNIIVNAIKFSHEKGIIKVDISRRGKDILVTVADSGVGIPEKDKVNVFEMFTPAKKTGTNGEQPFGLGLSISKKIIENHGGKIWFESLVGVGTTFYIQLPGE